MKTHLSHRTLGFWVLFGLIFGLCADPTPVLMAVGLTMFFAGYLWRQILGAWEMGFAQLPSQHTSLSGFMASFRYPQDIDLPVMIGPYQWMRAPWQFAHVMIGCGLAIMSGHFWVIFLGSAAVVGCFALQFYISEQNAKLSMIRQDSLLSADYQHYLQSTPIVSVKLFSGDNISHLSEISFKNFGDMLKKDYLYYVVTVSIVVFICLFK